MTVQTRPLSEVTEQAIAVLAREMGITDTVRFIRQFTRGYGNYTQERDALFEDLTLDEVFAEIEKEYPKEAG